MQFGISISFAMLFGRDAFEDSNSSAANIRRYSLIIRSRLNVLATLLLGGFVISQAVGQTGTPPSTSYDETHSLWLMTTMNSDNCTASGKLIWRPGESERAPVLPLIVGDAYEIMVSNLKSKEDGVLQWSGRWEWIEKSEKKCKCLLWCCERVDVHKKIDVGKSSGFVVGDTLKIRLFDDGEGVTEIKKDDVHNGIAIKSKMVEIKAPPFQFAPPLNPEPPDPRAVLQPPGLCAKILKPRVHVADFHIRIVRRLR